MQLCFLLDGRHFCPGDFCSIRYMGKHNTLEVRSISGDFGEKAACKDKKSNNDSCGSLETRMKDLKLSTSSTHEGTEEALLDPDPDHNWKDYSSGNQREHTRLFTEEFVYYLSRNETQIQFEVEEEVDTTLDKKSCKEECVTYKNIGGLSSQLDAVREVIEMPLRFPDLYQSCGKVSYFYKFLNLKYLLCRVF